MTSLNSEAWIEAAVQVGNDCNTNGRNVVQKVTLNKAAQLTNEDVPEVATAKEAVELPWDQRECDAKH
jgi:hypothetical protein